MLVVVTGSGVIVWERVEAAVVMVSGFEIVVVVVRVDVAGKEIYHQYLYTAASVKQW